MLSCCAWGHTPSSDIIHTNIHVYINLDISIRIYMYIHMSVCQYSLYNPVPRTNGGVPSLLRALAQLKTKVSLLGVSVTI